jgi:hypothetical protein
MAFIHGKGTVVKLNATDLSAFTNMTDFDDGIDTHDVTCYGASRKAKKTGLGDGKVTISGVYDDGAAGPRGLIKPLMAAGAPVTFLFQPEGTGAGKAQSSVSVLVKSFKESAPVADYIKWSCELDMTGALTETDQ